MLLLHSACERLDCFASVGQDCSPRIEHKFLLDRLIYVSSVLQHAE